MQIFLDFDGTVVEHYYPLIGAYNPNSKEVISKLQQAGHEVILNTYRVEIEDDSLKEALLYLYTLDLPLAITQKTKTKIHPPTWNLDEAIETGKLFIDDIATGIPLLDAPVSGGKMVDWKKIETELENLKIIY
jgi:hypothetical protein